MAVVRARAFGVLRAPVVLSMLGVLVGTVLVAGCASSTSGGGQGLTQVVTGSAGPSGQASSTRLGTQQPGYPLGYQLGDGQACPTSSTDPAIGKLRALTTESALPKGFNAVAVVRCSFDQRAVAGDGIWQYTVAQRASSGLSNFLRLLQQPSATQSLGKGFACAAVLMMVPEFGLVGSDGTVVRPKLPLTVCEQPMFNVISALNALPWKTETEMKTTQLQTQTEVVTGCYSDYKYLPSLNLGAQLPWSQVRQQVPTKITAVCEYRITGAVTPAVPGQLVGGAVLTGAQESAIEGLVNGASTASSAAAPCSVTATRFVTLGTGRDFSFLFELDGCRRLLFPNNYLATGPSNLPAVLAQAGIK